MTDDIQAPDNEQNEIKVSETEDNVDTWYPECPRCGGGLIPDEYEDGTVRLICDNYCGYYEEN